MSDKLRNGTSAKLSMQIPEAAAQKLRKAIQAEAPVKTGKQKRAGASLKEYLGGVTSKPSFINRLSEKYIFSGRARHRNGVRTKAATM